MSKTIDKELYKRICSHSMPEAVNMSDGKKLWIYGAGVGGEILASVLDEKRINFEGFVDERASAITSYMGKPVFSIKQVDPEDSFLLISLMKYEWEIIRVCINNGFRFEDIFYFSAGYGINREDITYKGCHVGRFTYGYEELLQFYPFAKSIGRYCSINGSARIWNNHPIECITTHPILDHAEVLTWREFLQAVQLVKKYGKNHDNADYENSLIRRNREVMIGNDVWIGANVVILPGVKIHDGAIIGAGAVVTRDIPPYAIALGVPATVVKYRFSEAEIEMLLETKWWDWSHKMIMDNIELFYDRTVFFNSSTSFGEGI